MTNFEFEWDLGRCCAKLSLVMDVPTDPESVDFVLRSVEVVELYLKGRKRRSAFLRDPDCELYVDKRIEAWLVKEFKETWEHDFANEVINEAIEAANEKRAEAKAGIR